MLILLLLLFGSLNQTHSLTDPFTFSFPSFDSTSCGNGSNLICMGSVTVSNGSLCLTPDPKQQLAVKPTTFLVGRVLYKHPVLAWPAFFSTTFTVVILPEPAFFSTTFLVGRVLYKHPVLSHGDLFSGCYILPGATTRKSALQAEKQNSEMSYYADDEDANRKKYTRRGSFRNKFLRLLLPFWSSSLPTLPVTVPSRKDASYADEVQEGRTRHPRTSRMDPRKILLIIAIMACMATMGILYYRLAQRGFGEELPEEEPRQQ